MKHETEVELVRELFRHLDAGTTATAPTVSRNPVESYIDPQRLKAEKEILFRDYPLLAGFSCQLREPGTYLTDDYSGVPVLLVRGRDGALRAFVNVCRHRGAKVATGCGNTGRTFVCPYHAWSYDLTGKLVGIPDRRNFDGIEPAEHGLVELPAAEKYGMMWVRHAPGGPIDVDDYLSGLGPEFAAYGFADYHHYETRTLRRRMNWKLVVDTFLEPYHFAALHKDTVGPIFFPNLCLFHPFGDNLRETLPRRSINELRALPEREWDLITHTAIVYVLFPNTVFVMQADHVETWRVYPADDSTDECVMYLDFYIPEAATSEKAKRHWERNMDLAIRTVAEEDFPTSEGIQFGFHSGAQRHVTYGRNEPALAHFQKAVARAIEDGVGGHAAGQGN